MEQNTSLQVIELQQLPVIVERLHSVKADIEQRTTEALSLVCTEQTYKSVKDARAQLTKEFKEYEAQRIAVKNKILEPYEAFEQVYRECITEPFQKADAELKQKITDVTSGIVAQKTDAVMGYYDELVKAADIDWMDDLNYRPKVNMSDSLTSFKKQAKAFVDGIVADIAAITAMENSAEIMVEYRKISICPVRLRRWTIVTRLWRNSGGGKKNAVSGRQNVKLRQKKFAPQLQQQPRRSLNRRRKFQ